MVVIPVVVIPGLQVIPVAGGGLDWLWGLDLNCTLLMFGASHPLLACRWGAVSTHPTASREAGLSVKVGAQL